MRTPARSQQVVRVWGTNEQDDFFQFPRIMTPRSRRSACSRTELSRGREQECLTLPFRSVASTRITRWYSFCDRPHLLHPWYDMTTDIDIWSLNSIGQTFWRLLFMLHRPKVLATARSANAAPLLISTCEVFPNQCFSASLSRPVLNARSYLTMG